MKAKTSINTCFLNKRFHKFFFTLSYFKGKVELILFLFWIRISTLSTLTLIGRIRSSTVCIDWLGVYILYIQLAMSSKQAYDEWFSWITSLSISILRFTTRGQNWGTRFTTMALSSNSFGQCHTNLLYTISNFGDMIWIFTLPSVFCRIFVSYFLKYSVKYSIELLWE